jgi:hypothetical protein
MRMTKELLNVEEAAKDTAPTLRREWKRPEIIVGAPMRDSQNSVHANADTGAFS